MSDTLMAGASAAFIQRDRTRISDTRLQSEPDFLRAHPELSNYQLMRLIGQNRIEYIVIGSRQFLVVGSYERHLELEAALRRALVQQADAERRQQMGLDA